MESENDEKTLLTAAIERKPSSRESKEPLTIGEAIERLGCGFGSVLYGLGPYCFLVMEGAEVAVMAVVSLILKCEWGLSTFWTSALQMISMVTCTIFGFLLAHLGDRFGRRRILIITTIFMLSAGILSGLTRNLWQLLICRAIVGASGGIGAGPAATYSAEIPTIKYRSLSMSSVGVGWGIGTALSGALAYLTLGPYGWRGYLISIALLCSPILVLLLIIRESPRHDVRIGKLENAQETLKTLANLNCTKELGEVEITQDNNSEELEITTFYQSYQILRTTGYLSDFWKLVIITLTGQLVYMGAIYAAPLFMDEGLCHSVKITQKQTSQSCSFNNSVLFDLGVIGLADPIAVAIGLLLVDKIGRRNLFFISSLIPVFVFIPLYFCIPSVLKLTVLLVTRGTLAVMGWLNFVLASEYFPTSVRSFTSSIVNSCYGLASIIASLAVQYAYHESSGLVVIIMQIALVVSASVIYSIKREMTGEQLEQ